MNIHITDGVNTEVLVMTKEEFISQSTGKHINIDVLTNYKLESLNIPPLVLRYLKDNFVRWARYDNKGYEISSKGDKFFSAFFCRLPNGDSIEEAYQLDIKGYRKFGNHWKLGKGKPPLDETMTPQRLYKRYKGLWILHYLHHKNKVKHLDNVLRGQRISDLTDMFATSEINQAKVHAELINELRFKELEESIKAQDNGIKYVEYK